MSRFVANSWAYGLFVSIVACALAGDAGAEARVGAKAAVPSYEAWSGGDATGSYWSLYGGMTAAPFGDVRTDGLRVRGGGGYGQYRYERRYFDPFTRKFTQAAFRGQHTYVDTLLGYHLSLGPVTLKAFAGYSEEHHIVAGDAGSPIAYDADNTTQGTRHGAKVVVETWTRLSDWGFLQADASWSQPFEAVSGRLRLGYRPFSQWSVGLESAAFGTGLADQGRIGAFVRFEWGQGEVSLSGGAGGDATGLDGGYAAINGVMRF